MAAAMSVDETGALVKELLAAKASVEPVGESGQTALTFAAASARAGAVRELLAAKASTNNSGAKVQYACAFTVADSTAPCGPAQGSRCVCRVTRGGGLLLARS